MKAMTQNRLIDISTAYEQAVSSVYARWREQRETDMVSGLRQTLTTLLTISDSSYSNKLYARRSLSDDELLVLAEFFELIEEQQIILTYIQLRSNLYQLINKLPFTPAYLAQRMDMNYLTLTQRLKQAASWKPEEICLLGLTLQRILEEIKGLIAEPLPNTANRPDVPGEN
ncbi:MAG: hypothetical protein LH609_13085 [Rudanella sp.]|nr:hypothetical protein [Rudanella sp.]